MSSVDKPNIEERIKLHQESVTRTKALIEDLMSVIDSRDCEISELLDSIKKLQEDNIFQKELISTMDDSEKRLKATIQDLKHDLSSVRVKRDLFKQDAANNRSVIKSLEGLLVEYENSGVEISELLELVTTELNDDFGNDSQSSVESTAVIATGAFVCCVNEDLGRRHERWFRDLKKRIPQINFADNMVRILSDKHRPPIPHVDVVIFLTNGLSHPDGNAVRSAIRSMDPVPHILSASSISFVLIQLRKWLKNKEFSQVSS